MNKDMGYDPRPICNAILDLADELNLGISNLTLNKILFFAHEHWLGIFGRPLSRLSFEAWQYGPVLPLIYHQFKSCGDQNIRSRATRLDSETGEDICYNYDTLELEIDELKSVVSRYGRFGAGKLIQLSHIEGGAWHKVWHSSPDDRFGMIIPDSLIAEVFNGSLANEGDGKYVH
ncbi:MAG: type II toxin-antitoxin system antitoxin SocA domain-containing protein [Pseudomonadota bacterium]